MGILKNIAYTIGSIVVVALIPLIVVDFVKGDAGYAIMPIIIAVIVAAICVSRYKKNKKELDKLADKFDELNNKGYSVEESAKANDDLDNLRDEHSLELITFPWWEAKKLKLKKSAKKASTPAPKEEKADSHKEPEPKPAQQNKPVETKPTEQKPEESAKDAEPVKATEPAKESEDSAKKTEEAPNPTPKEPEKPAESAAEKQSTELVTVFECKVITPPMTAHNECMKTFRQIMDELGSTETF